MWITGDRCSLVTLKHPELLITPNFNVLTGTSWDIGCPFWTCGDAKMTENRYRKLPALPRFTKNGVSAAVGDGFGADVPAACPCIKADRLAASRRGENRWRWGMGGGLRRFLRTAAVIRLKPLRTRRHLPAFGEPRMLRSMFVRCAAFALVLSLATTLLAAEKIKTLIIEGQNNHGNWPQTSQMMQKYLEETDLFAVDIARTKPNGEDPDFKPDFSKYQLVLSNYNGAPWPKETQTAFIDFVKNGGGFVVVHAADNSFGDWKEYNEMIGLGGWGGRNEKTGPYVYFNDQGEPVRDEKPGGGGSHGSQHPFQIVVRDAKHPITDGMPKAWMHANDELYDRLRGPAENMKVLATAYAEPSKGGTGRHEPMLLTIEYGKGRVFHTPMGHGNDSQECVGFIATLVRGAEWAATGDVTTPLPDDFPGEDEPTLRPFAAKR